MKILINGDSNMSGEELTDKNLSIGSQLCKLLEGTEINLALSGASNDRIYNTTIEYIEKKKDIDLVVIGWSEMSRVQWFMTDNGYPEFVEINNLGVGRREYPKEYDNRLAHWFETSNKTEHRTGLSHYWHERIYNLHKYLEYYKISHVFFHAFHDFRIHNTQYQLDWNNRFISPYNQNYSYIYHSMNNGYKEITPGWYHFEPAAQLAWAEYMFDHIQKYNLIN